MHKIVYSYLIILFWCHVVFPGKKKKLIDAIVDGDLASVQRVVNDNPDIVSFRAKDGKTLLHYAVTHNAPPIAEFLLSAGANINACDDWGNTPLINAVINGCSHVVASLLRAHPDCDPRGYMGRTALYHACYNNDLLSVHLLLKAGADAQIPDRIGVTPLHVAAQNGCYDTARLLVRRHAPQDARDEKGRIPLHYAAMYKRPDIAELLLEYDGTLIDFQDGLGSTPLHYTAELGELSLVRLLISRYGASFITNNYGHTPSDRAVSYNNYVILNFFLCYGLPMPTQAIKKLQTFYPDCKEILALAIQRVAEPLVYLLRANNLDVIINQPTEASEGQQSAHNKQSLSELLLAFMFCDTETSKRVVGRLAPILELG